MRFIDTRTNGYIDYLMGVILISAPWLFEFDNSGAQTLLPFILGHTVIVYSILTAYELGAARIFTMRTHLLLDVASGLFLAASPWIFGFAINVNLPHVILGILLVGAGLFTKTEPSKNTRLTGQTHIGALSD